MTYEQKNSGIYINSIGKIGAINHGDNASVNVVFEGKKEEEQIDITRLIAEIREIVQKELKEEQQAAMNEEINEMEKELNEKPNELSKWSKRIQTFAKIAGIGEVISNILKNFNIL